MREMSALIHVKSLASEVDEVLSALGGVRLSYWGYVYLFITLLRDGREKALKLAHEIRVNAPGDRPSWYRHLFFPSPVYRDSTCGFVITSKLIPEDKVEEIPVDVYPGTLFMVYGDDGLTALIEERADEVFSFIKENVDVLRPLQNRTVTAVVRRFLREGADAAVKYAIKRSFVDALRYVLDDYGETVRLGGTLAYWFSSGEEDVGVLDIEKLSLTWTRFSKFAKAVLSRRGADLKAEVTGLDACDLLPKEVKKELVALRPELALIL